MGVRAERAHGRTSDVGAIIFGTGIAGLRAAQTLISAGRSVLVLEAANRIGGRAFTDTSALERPFDMGCSWINAGSNPFLIVTRDRAYALIQVIRQSGQFLKLLRNDFIPRRICKDTCLTKSWARDQMTLQIKNGCTWQRGRTEIAALIRVT